jgi:NAD(P)-dependent dehydrogenase (short-subunit alcohol dehydrogenase family)
MNMHTGVSVCLIDIAQGGIEKQFMVNVLAYYMLMVGLGDLLRAAPQGRIVNVASNFAGGLVLDDLQFDRRYAVGVFALLMNLFPTSE